MNTHDFLTAIWPPSDHGYYCLAYGQPGQYRHTTFPTIEAAADAARRLSASGVEVFHAVATLREPYVTTPEGRRQSRVRRNMSHMAALFADIDVRPDGESGAYADVRDALAAAKSFCSTVGIPLPMVVSSGYGIHLYWLLAEVVPVDDMEPLMRQLVAVAKALDFKLDRHCSDVTRLLRTPGSLNLKHPDEPREAAVVRAMPQRVDVSVLRDALTAAAQAHHVEVAAPTSVPTHLQGVASNLYDAVPLQYDRLKQSCAVVKLVDDAKYAVPYPVWMHTLQLIRHCENGTELCHTLSAQADTYDRTVTNTILAGFERGNIAPTLCDTFAELNDATSAACAACPHRGRVRTPAVLGRAMDRVAQVQREEAAAAGQMPEPPYPYTVSERAGIQTVVVNRKTDEEEVVVVYPYPILPVTRVYSERTASEHIVWRVTLPQDGDVELRTPAESLYDRRAFISTVMRAGIYCALNRVDLLRDYMIRYAHDVQRVFAPRKLLARQGWRDDYVAFAIAGSLITPEGATECAVDLAPRVAEAMQTAGTFDGWRDIVRMFEHRDFAAHQFALATAFGSVLMPFTGLAGGVINLVGRSGEGKSTVQKVVNSVWGHPIKLMLPADAKASTYNAKVSFINQMNNLPICAEEITNAAPDEVGQLAYAITQGSEKWRSAIDGQVRDSLGGWCTIMLSSANNSLHEMLIGSRGAQAKALRIFEYRVPHVTVHSRADFRANVDLALMHHYGHAGKMYLEYLLRDVAARRDALVRMMDVVDARYGFAAEERVWTAIIAANMCGLQFAAEAGLISPAMDAVWAFLDDAVSSMRAAISGAKLSAMDTLGMFLDQHVQDILVVEQQGTSVYVVQTPRSRIVARYEQQSKILYVSAAELSQWCRANGLDSAALLADLAAAGVEVSQSRTRLAANTDFPSVQSRCVRMVLAAVAGATALTVLSNVQQQPVKGVSGGV